MYLPWCYQANRETNSRRNFVSRRFFGDVRSETIFLRVWGKQHWADRDIELRCNYVSEAGISSRDVLNWGEGPGLCTQALTTHRIWAALGKGITRMRQIPQAEDISWGGAQLWASSRQTLGGWGNESPRTEGWDLLCTAQLELYLPQRGKCKKGAGSHFWWDSQLHKFSKSSRWFSPTSLNAFSLIHILSQSSQPSLVLPFCPLGLPTWGTFLPPQPDNSSNRWLVLPSVWPPYCHPFCQILSPVGDADLPASKHHQPGAYANKKQSVQHWPVGRTWAQNVFSFTDVPRKYFNLHVLGWDLIFPSFTQFS